ncbi:MAG: hypothetical protein KF795_16630 [Labilithrix sp.]|nr:hypothetical protein [Labilithrix sp.]
MKEDAAAKELEDLLRDALNTGLESPRGGTPLLQLKTVPLQVQQIPMKQAAPRPATATATAPPNSGPGLADKLAPDSIRPAAPAAAKDAPKAKRSRSSLVALLVVGGFALAAAGGAAWLARQRDGFSMASAATRAPAESAPADVAPAEGAVGLSVAARPADGPATEGAPADVANATPTPPPPPTFNSGSEAPPASTAVAATTARADKPEAKEAKPTEVKDAKPETKDAKPAEVKAKPVAPAPVAKPAPEKTATAEKVEKKEAPPPAAPTPPAASVDALLEQQLKGAIP